MDYRKIVGGLLFYPSLGFTIKYILKAKNIHDLKIALSWMIGMILALVARTDYFQFLLKGLERP